MAESYHVAFWNLENLFAPEGFALREPWIADAMERDLRGWTEDLFERKVGQLVSIIAQMNDGRGPDLLGVCEAENRFVLDRLAARLNAALATRDYRPVHVDATRDRRGIDTAFLHDAGRLSADPDLVFSHWVMRRTGTRDITQASFRTRAGNELIAMCNHWPSRSGGAYESRGFRMTAGETLSYWHQRIWEERGADMPIVAFGDFNDDPFDASLLVHARATRELGDVVRARTAARFYNLSWRFLEQPVTNREGETKTLYGTLYFRGDANVFDQILVSRGLLLDRAPLRVAAETARIEAFAEMVEGGVSPAPIRFGLPRGDAADNVDSGGFSDHYPVSVRIEET
jgi:endonuclease/exonuclease/phosphatase family metal-dependent hydrolase